MSRLQKWQPSRCRMMCVLFTLAVCVTLLNLPLFSLASSSTADLDAGVQQQERREERVKILPYQLRGVRPVSSYPVGASSPAPSHPVGPWPFGHSREEDRVFYQKEDSRQVKWESWRALLLQEEEAERKRMANAQQENAGKGNGAGGAGSTLLSKLSMNSNFAKKDSFSDRQAARRTMEVLRIVGKNTTTLEHKLSTFYMLVSQLANLLQASDVYPEAALVDNTTLENRYKWLTDTVFAHSVIPAALRPTSMSLLPSFKALPVMMLLDEAVIEAVERETKSFRYNLKIAKLMPHAVAPSASDADSTGEDSEAKRKVEEERLLSLVESALAPLEQMVQDSKHALKLVEKLSYPYLERLQGYVSSTIDHIEKTLLQNDEATEAKRQKAKELLKEKSGLLALQNQLIQTGNDIVKARYREKQISAHSFIVGLSLIAKYRFNQSSGFEDLDALPFVVEDSIPSLGLLHSEFNSFLFFPLGLSIVTTVAAYLLVDEIRRFIINYAIKVTGEAKRKNTKPSVSKKTIRMVLRFLVFLKGVWSILPPIFFMVYFSIKGSSAFSWIDFFSICTMQVRLSFVGVVLVYVCTMVGTTYFALTLRDVAAPLPKVAVTAERKAKED